MALSEYQAMWLFAMFDLPVKTRRSRRRYTQFRKLLLREGFSMLQFSVYARYCVSEKHSDSYRRRIEAQLPPDGQVRLLAVTDRQFGKMEVFLGRNRTSVEEIPDQLLLF
ncbi:MAG: CRISPR-associated endonuclease Cas2 [Lacipirellulaceae bacterium]